MIILSKVLLAITIAVAIFLINSRKKNNLKIGYVIISGVFLSVWAAMAHIGSAWIYSNQTPPFFLSLLQSIQVMTAGFDFKNIFETFESSKETYFYIAFIFTLAPVCTFGFVLSFFERFTSFCKFALKRNQDAYIMSEINEKSVTFAKNIRKEDKNVLVIFKKDKENPFYQDAVNLEAVFFEKSVKDISLKMRGANAKNFFFAIGESESENLETGLSLIEKHRERQGTEIYIFSSSKVGGILIDSADKGLSKVRRINEMRQLAYSEVCNASPDKSVVCASKNGEISVLILGMGGYGTEFLKSVLWCGQLPGYTLKIHVIDEKENRKAAFHEMCPEIIDKNENSDIGESCYSLKFYEGVNVGDDTFEEIIKSIGNVSLAFISLGDDGKNIETSINLRTIMTRCGINPVIKSVVYSSEKHTLLSKQSLTNYKNQSYNISFIGSLSERFSPKAIMTPEIEKSAMEHHLSYVSVCAKIKAEEDGVSFEEAFNKMKDEEIAKFNKYEYFRDSSAASAIYRSYFRGKNFEDKETLSIYEHMRWNAYMRCEGYVFGEVRDDIAKTHPDLVHFRELSKADIDKDREMVKMK